MAEGRVGRKRPSSWLAVFLGLILGVVLASTLAGANDPPSVTSEDSVEAVAQFVSSGKPEIMVVDHEGHYVWKSPLVPGSVAKSAEAYVVEPRFVGVTAENVNLTPVVTDEGTQLVYEFDVVAFEKDAKVVILGAHADDSPDET